MDSGASRRRLGGRIPPPFPATSYAGFDIISLSCKALDGARKADGSNRACGDRGKAARGTAPGSTGPSAAEATARFEALADLLLDAAPREMLLRRLGQALAQTSRQVNTLEQRLAPTIEGQMTSVRRTLEEREREVFFVQKILKAKLLGDRV